MFSVLQSALQEIVEQASDGIVLIDSDGGILLANRAMVSLFGYGRTELVGKRLEMLLPSDKRETHKNHRSEFFGSPKQRQMGTGLLIQGQKKDGSMIDLDISIFPVETSEGVLACGFIRKKPI